ncbi:MAG: hypothetical protein ACRENA_12150 [Vulcanimicrobiaceae bacterium]
MQTAIAAAAMPSVLDVDARARAAGNQRIEAERVARALLAQPWAMQLIQVEVDRVGSHRVAGVTLLGVKLKRKIAAAGFLAQANRIVDITFASDSQLEEVDLRVTVPSGPRGSAGDMDQVYDRAVFTLTVRRSSPRVREAYWDAAWRAGLVVADVR